MGRARAQTTPAYTPIHVFTGQNGEGQAPAAGVIQGRDGNFYGTANTGGLNNNGTVFQMTAQGVVTPLHTFSATSAGLNADGANPVTSLVESATTAGTFYGTANGGGTYGFGTLFKITPARASSPPCTSFRDTPNDGANPNGLIASSDGSYTLGTTAPVKLKLVGQ